MGTLLNLSVIALRQVVTGACQAVGGDLSGQAAGAVVGFLTERFTDQSGRLSAALQTANERAWKAFEVALGGESLWDKCKVALARAEDQAFRAQVRAFLDISPLTRASTEHAQVFNTAWQELRAARSRGALTGGRLAPDELGREVGAFARFSDPQAVLDAEWKVVERAAAELRELCPNLWKVLVARTRSGQRPSILAAAVRYYFRREVETDPQLFQGLAFANLQAIKEEQDRGFSALTEALTRQGQRLEELLLGLDQRIKLLDEKIQRLLDKLQLQDREVRPSDSLSIRDDGERALVKQLVAEYRALPPDQRHLMSTLLNQVGKLEVAAGAMDDAHKDFQEVAVTASDPKLQAEAHHNAYRAALERQQWAEALADLRQAVALDPARFAPFPFERYEPQRTLGAGGFGVVFLCQHRYLSRPIVVKSLLATELDRAVTDVFAEATALEELDHPAIIRLKDCAYADEARTRPYLVMDYFEGVSLADHIATRGPLSPEDLLAIASQVAGALQAAHARGILHRDVKPANLLIRRDDTGWRVKVIDFGLALRPETLEGKASTEGSQARTAIGRSIAGTLRYAAPEQMGHLPGVRIGTYSDVYGFGKTCYYALLKTPDPDDGEREDLPQGWRQFLSRCTRNDPSNRLSDFAAVQAALAQIRQVVTNVTVVSSQNPAPKGQAVTFTAAVNAVPPGTETPTGTVSFMDGATDLGSAPLGGGAATLTTSALAAGSHSITANYSGEAQFAASTSTPLTQTVEAPTSVYTPAHEEEYRTLTREGNQLLRLRRSGRAEQHHLDRIQQVKARKRVLEALRRGEVAGPAPGSA